MKEKVIGSVDDRGVSPVIGVILMVAITVILAATIATLVMDFGQGTEKPINARIDASAGSDEVELQVVKSDEAEKFILRGTGVDSEIDLEGELNPSTGSTFTLDYTSYPISPNGGMVNVVAINGDREDTVGSFEVPSGAVADVDLDVTDDGIDTYTFDVTGSDAGTVDHIDIVVSDGSTTIDNVFSGPTSSPDTISTFPTDRTWAYGSNTVEIKITAYDSAGDEVRGKRIVITDPSA